MHQNSRSSSVCKLHVTLSFFLCQVLASFFYASWSSQKLNYFYKRIVCESWPICNIIVAITTKIIHAHMHMSINSVKKTLYWKKEVSISCREKNMDVYRWYHAIRKIRNDGIQLDVYIMWVSISRFLKRSMIAIFPATSRFLVVFPTTIQPYNHINWL